MVEPNPAKLGGGKSLHTSFIPKQAPTVAPRKKSTGGGGNFLFFLSIIILLVSFGAWAGSYAYVSFLERQVEDREVSLANAREAFDPGLLKVFENLDRRLTGANQVLDSHTSLAPFFSLLDELTLLSVRYTDFDYGINEGIHEIKMSGEALGFPSIALQAKAFGSDNRVLNPIFSDLNVKGDGTVSFQVSFEVDPSLILYTSNLGL